MLNTSNINHFNNKCIKSIKYSNSNYFPTSIVSYVSHLSHITTFKQPNLFPNYLLYTSFTCMLAVHIFTYYNLFLMTLIIISFILTVLPHINAITKHTSNDISNLSIILNFQINHFPIWFRNGPTSQMLQNNLYNINPLNKLQLLYIQISFSRQPICPQTITRH